ncbi:MAG: uroporphyrinogen decarboxylase family protein [Candidatus Bathyarchaeia archaeon]
MRILRKQPVEDRIVWAPRLEHWYEVNRFTGKLPSEYQDKSLLEICDDLGASPRTYYFFEGTIKTKQGGDVKINTTEDTESIVSEYSTPKRRLKEVRKKTIKGLTGNAVAPYWTEHLAKDVDDFPALEYFLENQTFEFDRELYKKVAAQVGDRGPPCVCCPAVPIANLTIRYLGLLKTNVLLRKHPEKMMDLLDVLDDNNRRFLDAFKSSPIPIINFDDNIDRNLFSPPMFTKYILPYYKRRTAELHTYGKLCTAHWDGKLASLLQFARETGLDGIECMTPKPQGDVTLEEIHSALGDLVLLDGIPAISFLPWAADNDLEGFVRELLHLFLPHLILGVSDLVPPNADVSKIRLVRRLIEKYQDR